MAERALARSYTTGDGRIGFAVSHLSDRHHVAHSATLTYEVVVARQGRGAVNFPEGSARSRERRLLREAAAGQDARADSAPKPP